MTDGASIRSREDLQAYLDHFNRREYDRQIAYYAPDVLYKVGSLTLRSPEAIAAFYAEFHEHVKEHVEIALFALDGDTVAVAMPSRFEPFKDYEMYGLSYRAGHPVEFVSFVFYRLSRGKIRRIRVARYPGTAADLTD